MRIGRSMLAICGAVCAAIPVAASAAIVMPVSVTYASGASFQGQVTFADDYSSVLGVTGTLYGYSNTSTAYTPGASSTIDTLYNGGADMVNSPWVYGTQLQASSGGTVTNYIQFSYNFKNGAPDFSKSANGVNSINNSDAYTAVSFVAGVPEPSMWLILILGFGGIGAMLRHERHRQRVTISSSKA